MVEPSSPPPTVANGSSLFRQDMLRDEEVALLRKLALTKKRWWQDYALLIAGLAFLLSFVTTMISAWTAYWKDIHDLQAQLVRLTLDIKDLRLQEVDISKQHKDEPILRSNLLTLLNTQERAIQRDAVDIAQSLGTKASTGQLVILAQDSAIAGNVKEAMSLYDLAVSASASPLDESWALRNLAGLQTQVIGSPAMRAEGLANFQRALDLEVKYPDLKEEPYLRSYIKTMVELQWAHALVPADCNEARVHFGRAKNYLSDAAPADRQRLEQQTSLRGDATFTPPGCPATPGQ
jgi:hypothetical protein